MEQVISPIFRKKINSESSAPIPSALLYEVLDGKPIYYKGYKKVISGEKKIHDIMGCSGLQMHIISAILRFLYKNLPEYKYEIGTNEAGLHIAKNINLSSDIVIYALNTLNSKTVNDHYLSVHPKIVIEVDIQADFDHADEVINYYHSKVNHLLAFGVEKVIWVTSQSKKIMIATPKNWTIIDWTQELIVCDDYRFTLQDLLDKRGILKK